MLRKPRNKKDQTTLEEINDVGERVAELFFGRAPVVAINVAAAILVRSMKIAELSRENAHECIDSHWDADGGLTAQLDSHWDADGGLTAQLIKPS